ncbi:MAG: PepSY domain-containing protein [Jatrophihabitantaceae bacterium]
MTRDGKNSMDITSGKRPLVLGVAVGVAGAAAVVSLVAFRHSSSTPAVVAPVGVPVSSPAPVLNHTGGLTHARMRMAALQVGPATVRLDGARIRTIAQRSARGRSEQIVRGVASTGSTYEVSVERIDGTELRVVLDAHSGRVLATLTEPADGQDGSGVQEPGERQVAGDAPVAGDQQDAPQPQDAPQDVVSD